jgi:hypothetical protein
MCSSHLALSMSTILVSLVFCSVRLSVRLPNPSFLFAFAYNQSETLSLEVRTLAHFGFRSRSLACLASNLRQPKCDIDFKGKIVTTVELHMIKMIDKRISERFAALVRSLRLFSPERLKPHCYCLLDFWPSQITS